MKLSLMHDMFLAKHRQENELEHVLLSIIENGVEKRMSGGRR